MNELVKTYFHDDIDDLLESFKNEPIIYSGEKTSDWLEKTHCGDKKTKELIEFIHGMMV